MSATEDRDGFAPGPPDEPFVAPLILRAASRRRAVVLRDLLVTVVVWCGWLYLLVAAVGVFWIPPFVHELLPVSPPESPWPTIEIVLACAVLALLGTVLIAGRAMLDRRRFAGADRRRAMPDPTDAELAAALDAATLDLAALRAARRIVLHHAPHRGPESADLAPDAPAR